MSSIQDKRFYALSAITIRDKVLLYDAANTFLSSIQGCGGQTKDKKKENIFMKPHI
jgi:hypothetical protein